MKKVLMLFLFFVSVSNTFSQKKETPKADPLKAIKLAKEDLPAGYAFSDQMKNKSLQAAVFYEGYETTYNDLLGKLKKKEFQSVVGDRDEGTIFYFEFEKDVTATQTSFLEGYLWGGDGPSREHPEEFYAKGNILVIWSTLNYSFIKERSKIKIGQDIVAVSQALLLAKKKGTDKDLIGNLEAFLNGTKPVIPAGNTVSAGNTYTYNLKSLEITNEGFYALMLQNSNGKMKADAFDPRPSNAGEIASTQDFIDGLKGGKLKTDNEIYQYVNGLFATRKLFELDARNGALTFAFKDKEEKEHQVYLRQQGNVIYMANINVTIFTTGLEFVSFTLAK